MARRCTAKLKKTGKQCKYKALDGKRKCGHHAQKSAIVNMIDIGEGPKSRGVDLTSPTREIGPAEWTDVEKSGKADKRFEYSSMKGQDLRTLPRTLHYSRIGGTRAMFQKVRWDPENNVSQRIPGVAQNWG